MAVKSEALAELLLRRRRNSVSLETLLEMVPLPVEGS